jgi:hypothetical protein
MTKLTLKEFISQLNDRLEKFSHDELKEIIRGHAIWENGDTSNTVRHGYCCSYLPNAIT